MENSRRCDISNIDVHKASFAKHLCKKKQLENEKQKNDNGYLKNLSKMTYKKF